jgi:hypothetical protein
MSNPNLEGVNISAKFGHQINTPVPFSQSKVAWDESHSTEY